MNPCNEEKWDAQAYLDILSRRLAANNNTSERVKIDTLDKSTPVGIKYDTDKPDYSLIPPWALDDVVKILTLGSQKYSAGNWRLLDNAKSRYFAAAMRHLWATARGEKLDPESGISHYAHAICCILFLLEMEYESNDTK